MRHSASAAPRRNVRLDPVGRPPDHWGAMTPETYLQRVRSLLPTLRERADYAEKLRRLPDETFADFQEAGLFRCLQPKRYGGYELDPGILYQAIIDIGT